MYKYGKIIALVSTVGWLVFIFAAFVGFRFWYAGFVFFFWLTLASLNYRHDTSLWFLKNRLRPLLVFYFGLVVLAFLTDFVVGQKLGNFWTYPPYDSIDDWARLYLIVYPFGGLAVLELVYFLAFVFGEQFRFVEKTGWIAHKFICKIDSIWSLLLVFSIFISPIFLFFGTARLYRDFMFWIVILWPIVAVLKLRYHIAHFLHWLLIFIATTFLSVFLHEIPNTSVFEWKYGEFSIFRESIMNIPLWVILGWSVLVLGMFRLWLYFVLRRQKN